MNIEAMFGLENTPHDEPVVEMPVHWIHPYPDQPFDTYSNDRLQELADDIKNRGLDNPIIVRKLEDEDYQIIAGHNRFRAMKLLKWSRIPVQVKELDDDEALIYLVQSNLMQRTEIKQSELSKAYAMRASAMKRQGQRGEKKYSMLEKLSDSEQIKPRKMARYIACAKLIPDLLELLDQKKFSLNIGEQLAKLTEDNQEAVAEYLVNHEEKLKLDGAKLMVEEQIDHQVLDVSRYVVKRGQNHVDNDKINKVYTKLQQSDVYTDFCKKFSGDEAEVKSLLKMLLDANVLK